MARKTDNRSRKWNSEHELRQYYWNESYAGYFKSESENHQCPSPNLELDHGSHSGNRILPDIVDTWRRSHAPTYYKDTIEVPDELHSPDGYEKRKMG